MSTGRKRIIAGVLALAAVLVVGCGSSSDDTSSSEPASSPEDAVQTFYDTSKAEDGAGACAVLSSDSQDIAAAGADSCEAAFDAAVKAGQANVPDKLEIGDVQVDGDTATVAVTADGQKSSFTLINEDGEWKIDLTNGAASSTATDTTAPTDASTPTDATTP